MNTTCETKVYINEKEYLLNYINVDKAKVDIDMSINFVAELKNETDEFLDNLLKNNPQFLTLDKKSKNEDDDEENNEN